MNTATLDLTSIIAQPSCEIEDVSNLRDSALCSSTAWEDLQEAAKAFEAPANPAMAIKQAYCLVLLGRAREALAQLDTAGDSPAAGWVKAQALLECGKPAEAQELLAPVATCDAASSLPIKATLVRALRSCGQAEAALKLALKLYDAHPSQPFVAFELGAAYEQLGRYDMATEHFEETLALDPTYAEALFRLAYHHELRGSREQALSLYGKLAATQPAYARGLINYALMLEDDGDYDQALDLYNQVLAVHPNHARARLFRDDALASLDMYYDEEQARRSDRRNAILRIPVTDFELSVRARNCLNKMNIRNLGDLVTKTEEELLSYKNFGETSLQEIKQMLAQKGLWLGMFREPSKTPQAADGSAADLLSKPISALDLSVRARNCMERLQIRTVGELAAKSELELMGVKNFGQTSLNETKQKLTALGIGLRQV